MSETQTAAQTADYATILGAIREELSRVCPAGTELTEATDITSDLELDSLAVMDLLFALEESFDISVPISELGDVHTIGQLAERVASLAKG